MRKVNGNNETAVTKSLPKVNKKEEEIKPNSNGSGSENRKFDYVILFSWWFLS